MVVPAEAVPGPITLSEGEKDAYMRMRDTLLQATLREYDVFNMENPGRRASSVDWKLVKTEDGISVYKQRSTTVNGSRKEVPLVPRLLTPEGRFERVETNISVPQMLVTGTMRGSVDDAIYGGFVDSPEAHAKRGFYIMDRSSDFRVLAPIETPNEMEPYRFTGLTWTEMGGSGVPFVRHRDLVTIVSSGILTRPHDRIGFYIIHSVSHPYAPPLHDHKLIRAKSSFCYLFRQPHSSHDGYVETYQKGFFAPLGDVPERGVLAAVVRVLTTTTSLIDAAHGKKLCFMLKHAPPSSRRRSSADDEMDIADQGCAGGCSRSRSDSFFGVASATRPLRKLQQQNHGMCVLCKLPVCSSCKVVKKLAVDATGYDVEIKSLGFCILCVNKAKTISAALFARQERSKSDASTSSPSFASSGSRARRTSSGGASVSSVTSGSDSRLHGADSGLKRSDSSRHRSDSGLHRSDSGLKRSDSGSKRSDSVLHRSESGVKRSDSGLQPSDDGLHRSDSRLKRSGSGLLRSNSSGIVSISTPSGSATVSNISTGITSPGIAGSSVTSPGYAGYGNTSPNSSKQPPPIPPRRRPPPPPPPQHAIRQALYQTDTSPSSGVHRLKPDQPPAVAPRRRIDERVAIEDIALRGILL